MNMGQVYHLREDGGGGTEASSASRATEQAGTGWLVPFDDGVQLWALKAAVEAYGRAREQPQKPLDCFQMRSPDFTIK